MKTLKEHLRYHHHQLPLKDYKVSYLTCSCNISVPRVTKKKKKNGHLKNCPLFRTRMPFMHVRKDCKIAAKKIKQESSSDDVYPAMNDIADEGTDELVVKVEALEEEEDEASMPFKNPRKRRSTANELVKQEMSDDDYSPTNDGPIEEGTGEIQVKVELLEEDSAPEEKTGVSGMGVSKPIFSDRLEDLALVRCCECHKTFYHHLGCSELTILLFEFLFYFA